MSDTTQRRGTDYDSLRNLGAGIGRSPREAEDPLAELARLVSQGDPYAAPEEPRTSYAPPPRAAAQPAVERQQERDRQPQDRLDPIAPAPSSLRQANFDPRAYGATSHPDYDPNDFFSEPVAAAPAHPNYGTTYRDDFDDDGFAPAPHAAYHDDFEDPAAAYPAYDDNIADQDMPVRSRRGLVLAALMVLVAVGGVGAWATGMFGGTEAASGAPPVIKAESEPVKVVAEAKPVVQQKQSYDRIPVNADANVVTSAEEPGEKPAPRVILPGASSAPTESRVTETASIPTDSSDQASDPNAGRRVKTISIRPDGSFAPPPPEAPVVEAVPETPPAPIEGTGVASGMSMQPGSEFGIMASEAPSSAAASGPAVPMPEPRPSSAAASNYANQMPAYAAPQAIPAVPAAPAVAPQARASTPVPAPQQQSHGGQPWSPQPQVQITNKRPLKPVGAPGPNSQAVPAAPVAPSAPPAVAVPAAPRQVAMATPAPVALSPAPAAPAPVASTPIQARPVTSVPVAAPAPVQSRPAAPQVASVASSSAGGFGVQLTAQRSEAEALAAFNALKQRYPNVLGSYNAVVARADLGADRGVFYRAMVPAQSQADASNLCIQFKASGVDCIVQRR